MCLTDVILVSHL